MVNMGEVVANNKVKAVDVDEKVISTTKRERSTVEGTTNKN